MRYSLYLLSGARMERKECSELRPTLPAGYRFEQQSFSRGFELYFPEQRRHLFAGDMQAPVVMIYFKIFRSLPLKFNSPKGYAAYVEIQRDATREQVEKYVQGVEQAHQKIIKDEEDQAEKIEAERLAQDLERDSKTPRNGLLNWFRSFLK